MLACPVVYCAASLQRRRWKPPHLLCFAELPLGAAGRGGFGAASFRARLAAVPLSCPWREAEIAFGLAGARRGPASPKERADLGESG